jgi:hypothetical protein
MHKNWFILLAAAGLFSALQGCGNSTKVSGSVTFDGQPVANGNIEFRPQDGKGPVVGGEIHDGQYRDVAITPGPKIVHVIGVKKVNFARDQGKDAAKDKSGMIERADEIPADAEGNNAVWDVPAGQTVKNFDLKRPSPTAEKKAN